MRLLETKDGIFAQVDDVKGLPVSGVCVDHGGGLCVNYSKLNVCMCSPRAKFLRSGPLFDQLIGLTGDGMADVVRSGRNGV